MLTSSIYKFIKFYASVSLSDFLVLLLFFFYLFCFCLIFVVVVVDFVNPLINLFFLNYSLDTWIEQGTTLLSIRMVTGN